MDLLYARYSNPWNLLSLYINQGRFGEFVHGFLMEETNRKHDQAEKEIDLRLWIAFVHSGTQDTYGQWKEKIERASKAATKKGNDELLDDNKIQSIMKNLFPE